MSTRHPFRHVTLFDLFWLGVIIAAAALVVAASGTGTVRRSSDQTIRLGGEG